MRKINAIDSTQNPPFVRLREGEFEKYLRYKRKITDLIAEPDQRVVK